MACSHDLYSSVFCLLWWICIITQQLILTIFDKKVWQYVLPSQIINISTSPKKSIFICHPFLVSFIVDLTNFLCLNKDLILITLNGVQHSSSLNDTDPCGWGLQLVFPCGARATQNFLQIVAEFLSTDAIKEEIYPTVWRI